MNLPPRVPTAFDPSTGRRQAQTWCAPFDWIENGPALFGLLILSFIIGIVALGRPSHESLTTLWRPEIKQGDLGDYLYLVAATLGVTISPDTLYFYSSGAREEGWAGTSLFVNRVTAFAGMGFGSIGSIAIVLLAAIVLQPLNMQAYPWRNWAGDDKAFWRYWLTALCRCLVCHLSRSLF